MTVSDRSFCNFSMLLLFFISLIFTASSSTSISADVFESKASIGRGLLQAKKDCPVNFEFLNYTIITGKCKGPRYPPKLCCSALTEFACPYADDLNDPTNDCASTMFSYVNLYGKYPPGLFSSECKGDKNGLACPVLPPSASADQSWGSIAHLPSRFLIFSPGFVLLVWLL
ncbi:GPI-anchored protein LLG1-like [Cucurbita pepo subsp. pepo]|uniref:GPI-anchored protein LLG1-like n=1 Tax=Cucurbita pepo subsp. pepo TaxID=3664 RepID=UPI000C9D4377|nr:GPI-anchored protein LLG1-like [Cucurbita pepo subsp. pepo]XP_023525705.1 GPI-anchored protein LLG1-like [Cucurbita pepo subsp. pepo]